MKIKYQNICAYKYFTLIYIFKILIYQRIIIFIDDNYNIICADVHCINENNKVLYIR